MRILIPVAALFRILPRPVTRSPKRAPFPDCRRRRKESLINGLQGERGFAVPRNQSETPYVVSYKGLRRTSSLVLCMLPWTLAWAGEGAPANLALRARASAFESYQGMTANLAIDGNMDTRRCDIPGPKARRKKYHCGKSCSTGTI